MHSIFQIHFSLLLICSELNMDKIMQDKILLDACRHHPGLPFFHDAYKGWSCCNKKCIDFTEFLNIKGCTLSPHSNIVSSKCIFDRLVHPQYTYILHFYFRNQKNLRKSLPIKV